MEQAKQQGNSPDGEARGCEYKSTLRSPRALRPDLVERARALWDEGKTAGQIARALNVNKGVITGFANRYDFPSRPSPIKNIGREPNFSAARLELLERMWPTNATLAQIQAAINALPGKQLTRQTIRDKAHKWGLVRPGYEPRKKPPPRQEAYCGPAYTKPLTPAEIVTDLQSLKDIRLCSARFVADAARVYGRAV